MSSLERIELPSHTVQASRRSPESSIEFRQLRHQTKNALQRLIVQINQQPALQPKSSGRALADDLERRIFLSVSISDALFGFSRAPAPLEHRLRLLAQCMVQLLAKPGQIIELSVQVEGACPDHLPDTVLRIAHEMIGNAIKHGMDMVLRGRILVTLTSQPGGPATLVIRDDGWGPTPGHSTGEGHAIMCGLAAAFHGRIALSRRGVWTEASATFPPNPNVVPGRAVGRGPKLAIIMAAIAAMIGAAYLGLTLDSASVVKRASWYIGSPIPVADTVYPGQGGR